MAQPILQERAPRTVAAHRARPSGAHAADEAPHGFRAGVERVLLGIVASLVSVNLWTGGPLLALWVGSRIQASVGSPTMGAVGATIGVLVVVTLVLYKLLAILNARYYVLTGRTARRRQSAWLKPTTGERRSSEVNRPLTATERIVVVSVVVAFEVALVWFFFFAHYTFAS